MIIFTGGKQYKKRTLTHVNLMGKTVLLRTDFNVPIKDGVIEDNYRIQQSLPTIEYIIKSGAILVLMSHLGRPQGKQDERYSLKPVAKELAKLLGKRVRLAPAAVGENVKELVRSLRRGDVLLLENMRFHPEEMSSDVAVREKFAHELAELADLFINDAFAVSHRDHASIVAIAKMLPSCAGLLLQREIQIFENILRNPPRPMMVILGGVKVETKIPLIENLLPRADRIFIGGGMAYNFFKAANLSVGTFPIDESQQDVIKRILKASEGKLELPTDIVAGVMDFENRKPLEKLKVYPREKLPRDKQGFDIGPQTIRRWSNALASAKAVLWNGPVGFYECMETRKGTLEMAKTLAALTEKGVLTIVGGGDSAAAIKQAGLADKVGHLSTGGGASLMYLEGRTLPGLAVLENIL